MRTTLQTIDDVRVNNGGERRRTGRESHPGVDSPTSQPTTCGKWQIFEFQSDLPQDLGTPLYFQHILNRPLHR